MKAEVIKAWKLIEEINFKYLSEEMHAGAKAIGRKNFLVFLDDRWQNQRLATDDLFDGNFSYRLHEDYQPESDIKERKIDPLPAFDGGLGIRQGMTARSLSDCINDPDFIGFRFEDGYSRVSPILYRLNSGKKTDTYHAVDVKSGTAETMHATHVLFRETTL